MTRKSHLITVLAFLLATPSLGQYGSYAAPGSLGEERVLLGETLRSQQQDARWQFGPIEVEPVLSIGDLSYVSNVYSTVENEAQSDLKARGDAGLRAFMNLGPKLLVSPFAQLSYSWWQEQTELRSLNESLGVQLLGDFNRLQVEVQAGRVETQRNLSRELEIPVDQRSDLSELGFELNFWGPLSLFAGVAERENRYSGTAAEEALPGLDLSTLDVDTTAVHGGLSYLFPNGLRVGVGVERTEADFLVDPEGRSSDGTAQLLRVGIRGPRLSIDVDAAQRELEFDGRVGGAVRTQVTGLGQIGWKLTEKLSARVYRGIQLQPSALELQSFFEAVRSGFSLQHQPGPRSRVGIFYETGEDEFARVSDNRLTRVDEVTSFGLGWQLSLTPRLSLELGIAETRRDSSDPAFDRDLTSVTSRVSLGGDLLPW